MLVDLLLLDMLHYWYNTLSCFKWSGLPRFEVDTFAWLIGCGMNCIIWSHLDSVLHWTIDLFNSYTCLAIGTATLVGLSVQLHLFGYRYSYTCLAIDIATLVWLSIQLHFFGYRYSYTSLAIDTATLVWLLVQLHLLGYRYSYTSLAIGTATFVWLSVQQHSYVFGYLCLSYFLCLFSLSLFLLSFYFSSFLSHSLLFYFSFSISLFLFLFFSLFLSLRSLHSLSTSLPHCLSICLWRLLPSIRSTPFIKGSSPWHGSGVITAAAWRLLLNLMMLWLLAQCISLHWDGNELLAANFRCWRRK